MAELRASFSEQERQELLDLANLGPEVRLAAVWLVTEGGAPINDERERESSGGAWSKEC